MCNCNVIDGCNHTIDEKCDVYGSKITLDIFEVPKFHVAFILNFEYTHGG